MVTMIVTSSHKSHDWKPIVGYPFKSVKDVPPTNFLEQFGKDLANPDVSDLSQLKWVFDGKKVSQEQLSSAMKKVIDEWTFSKEIKDKWIQGEMTEEIFKQKLLQIFKVE